MTIYFLNSVNRLPMIALLSAGLTFAVSPSALAQDITSEAPEFTESVGLEADVMTYDRLAKTVSASGNVTIAHQGYVLIADEVTLSEATDNVEARGNVQITSPNGDVMLADHATLGHTLREGFIENVRVILNDGSRLAAHSGNLSENNVSELNNVSFTPCQICEDSGKDPVWQISAVKVVHDNEKQRIYYKNAVLEVFGFPVAYLPYLSHPDPRVERASGFLLPQISGRRELGFSVATPYYHVLNDNSDITLTPTFYSDERPLLDMEYRQSFTSGELKFSGQGTYTHERDDFNLETGRQVFRGAMFSDLSFNHTENWSTALNTQWASDDTFLRRYGFGEQDTLTSKIQTQAFFGKSYLSIQAVSYQGMHIEDRQEQTPIVMPMVNYSYVGKRDQFGGIVKADVNGLMLVRTEGMDTRRLNANTSWELPYTTDFGAKFLLKANLRGDFYNVSDANLADDAAFAGMDGSDARFLPQISLKLNWPLIQTGSNHYQIVEPIVDIIGAPNQTPSNIIPIEDSRTFELSDVNIYSDNRFPGIDSYEGSSRINYGLRWTVESGKWHSMLFVAQSYRLSNQESLFGQGSGLEGKFSDIVGRMEVGIEDLAQIIYRFRIDKDDNSFRRNEVDAVFGKGENILSVGYYQLNRGEDFIGLEDREEIRIAGSYNIKGNWTVYGDVTRNLTNGDVPIAQRLGLRYRDECLEFSLAWRKTFTSDRDIMPGSSIMFRINLKHLG